VIRFSAFLVVVAVGILVAGGITSRLLLVYIAIALSAVALLFLLIGAFLDRDELRAPAEAALAGADERADERTERRASDRARADEAGVAAAAAGIGPAGEDRTPAADRPAADRPAEDRPAEDTAVAGDRDDAEDSDDALRLAIKRIDKAAAKGVIHKNQAANRKARLMKHTAAYAAAAEAAED